MHRLFRTAWLLPYVLWALSTLIAGADILFVLLPKKPCYYKLIILRLTNLPNQIRWQHIPEENPLVRFQQRKTLLKCDFVLPKETLLTRNCNKLAPLKTRHTHITLSLNCQESPSIVFAKWSENNCAKISSRITNACELWMRISFPSVQELGAIVQRW